MKRIALTFDDGPNTSITPQVLDILGEHGIAASFFLIADSTTPESAQVAKRAFSMGCEINNHSTTHEHMSRMIPDQVRREVENCTQKIIELTGRAPRFFRPPYIDINRDMFEEIGLTFICGSGCQDWVPDISAEERIERVLANARDGEIVLLHDMPGNVNTVEALKTIIPELKKRGYRFLTCGQMFDECEIEPRHGWMYSNVFQTEPRTGL